MKPLGALALLALAAGWAVAAPAEPPSPAETQLPIDAPAANNHDTAQPQIVGVEALLSSLTDPRQSGPLAPRDDCGALGGANAFRRELSDAVIRRDIEALVSLADIDIKLDFGGGEGRAELRLRLSDPDSRLWQELDKMLPLGCAVNSQGGITLPWYFAQDFWRSRHLRDNDCAWRGRAFASRTADGRTNPQTIVLGCGGAERRHGRP